MPWTFFLALAAELGAVAAASLAGLTGLFLVGELSTLARQGLDPGSVAGFLGLFLLQGLSYTLPCSLLIAVLLAFGRMGTDGELTALRACGYKPRALVAVPLALAAAVSLLLLAVEDRVIPGVAARLVRRADEVGLNLAHFRTRFQDPVLTVQGQALYATDRRGDALVGFVMHEVKDGQPDRVTIAEQALLKREKRGSSNLQLDLSGVRVYAASSEAPTEAVAQQHLTTVGADKMGTLQIVHPWTALSLAEIAAKASKRADDQSERLWFTWWDRIARSLSPLALVLLGLPLAVFSRAGGKLSGVSLALLFVVGGYYPLAISGRILALDGTIPPAIGAFAAVTAFAVAGGLLLRPAFRGLR